MNRSIPVPIRRQLRQEVNYGCPVPGCGSPYLSYHHFDPPFHEGGTHHPEGMIALCLPHHKNADIGTYTDEQLKYFKENPYLNGQNVKGKIEWMRNEIIFRTGGLTAYKPNIFLEIGRMPIIWANRSESGIMLLNMDIRKSDGSSFVKIVDNDWEIDGQLSDLEAIPSGRSINISSVKENFRLELDFRDTSEEMLMSDIRKKIVMENKKMLGHYKRFPEVSISSEEQLFLEEWQFIKEADLSWPALIVNMRGKMSYPLPLTLRDKEMILPGNNTISGGTVINCNVALAIS